MVRVLLSWVGLTALGGASTLLITEALGLGHTTLSAAVQLAFVACCSVAVWVRSDRRGLFTAATHYRLECAVSVGWSLLMGQLVMNWFTERAASSLPIGLQWLTTVVLLVLSFLPCYVVAHDRSRLDGARRANQSPHSG